MSARSATAARARAGARPRRRTRAAQRRRRLLATLTVLALGGLAAVLLLPMFHQAVKEIALPLRHDDIIRQQATAKRLDPALVAAVIYAESHFIDGRTSSAGALGLMQLTPGTARYIAEKSGGVRFEVSDLATPQVNIAYGTWYLRYLLDRYGGNTAFALAAYNGGEGNVDRWVAQARAKGEPLAIEAIPFAETRAYVAKVLDARRQYRRSYAAELGL
jgi:peptidoglycan lytic transglycosylase